MVTFVEDFRGVLGGSRAGYDAQGKPLTNKPVFLTFSFQTSVEGLNLSGYPQEFIDSFKALSAQQMEFARRAFQMWDDASGITFFEVPSGQGDIKLAIFNFDLGGPFNSSQAAAYAGGEIFFLSDKLSHLYEQIYLHEIGHNLGFKHTHEGEFQLTTEFDNYSQSIMSYKSGGFSGNSLGILDKQAAEHIYGTDAQDGTQVSSWNWDAGSYTLSQIGFETDDIIRGVGGRNVIEGRGGNDKITFSGDSDQISGGTGDDTINGTISGPLINLKIDGGEGVDFVSLIYRGGTLFTSQLGITSVENIYLYSSNTADTLVNDANLNSISLVGGGGDDTLRAGDGANVSLSGGSGADWLFAGKLRNTLYGGADADRFIFESAITSGGSSIDYIADFQTGIDYLDLSGFATNGVRFVQAGSGTYVNSISGGFSVYVANKVGLHDIVLDSFQALGSNINDTLSGTAGSDFLYGFDGADDLQGHRGDDVLFGGRGADRLDGGDGIDTASYLSDDGAVFINLTLGRGYANASFGDTFVSIENVVGTQFNDFIIGDVGDNKLDGAGGNDTLIGAIGADFLIGGGGIDVASYEDNSGTVFVDLLNGKGFNNAAQGDTFSGIENIIGGLFDDTLIGNNEANRLDGALGADTLVGNGGSDTFVFNHAPSAASGFDNPNSSANVDKLFDFTSGEDKLEINSAAFGGGLTAGNLDPSAFVLGTEALDADDRFIYDQSTGNLYFDADGSGGGEKVLVAQFPNLDPIMPSDFVLV